jgi:hypothetical protein
MSESTRFSLIHAVALQRYPLLNTLARMDVSIEQTRALRRTAAILAANLLGPRRLGL